MSCGLPAGARSSLACVRTLQPKWRTLVTPAAPPTDYQTVAAPGGRTNTRTNTRTCSRTNTRTNVGQTHDNRIVF